MKATILNLLKTKFIGVADNILEGIAEKASKTITTEDAAKTYVEELTFQNILESYADKRVGEATKTAISNYEKKYGLKDGEKVGTGEPGDPKPKPQPQPKPEPDDVPQWAKDLREANRKLSEELAAMKQGKTTETRAAKLNDLIKGLTATQQKAYKRIDVSSMTDEAYDQLMKEVGEEVKQLETENRASAALGGKPAFAAGSTPKDGEASDEEVDRLMGIKK